MLIHERLALIASMQFGIGSPYDCHVYALRAPEGLVLIDTGSGRATEALVLETSRWWPGVPVCAAVLTHAHPDHAGGAAPLAELTGCEVFCPDVSIGSIRSGDEQATGLAEARAQGVYPADLRMNPWPAARPYTDGVPFAVAGQEFQPVRVTGHSPDSHCLLTELDGLTLMFAGDTVFYGGILGVINRNDSSMAGYRRDLPRLAGGNVDALLPGHGLFTLTRGQRHIDAAIEMSRRSLMPRQIGQFDTIF